MPQLDKMDIHFSYQKSHQSNGCIVFIHAIGLNQKMWKQITAPLLEDYDILTYDLRGHGQSLAMGENWSLELLANDLKRLLDHLQLSRCHLVGLSLGGMIAQTFTLSYPSYVEKLVLSNTTSGQTESSKQALLNRAVVLENQGMEPIVEETLGRWFTNDSHEFFPHLVELVRKELLACDPVAFAKATRAIAELELWDVIRNIRVPTLVMTGKSDPGTNTELAQRICDQIPGARLEIIPDASHMVPYEQPKKFAALIHKFLIQSSEGEKYEGM